MDLFRTRARTKALREHQPLMDQPVPEHLGAGAASNAARNLRDRKNKLNAADPANEGRQYDLTPEAKKTRHVSSAAVMR